MKIRRVGAELFHADQRTDRQTDMTKVIVAFRNFANALKNDNKAQDMGPSFVDGIGLLIIPPRPFTPLYSKTLSQRTFIHPPTHPATQIHQPGRPSFLSQVFPQPDGVCVIHVVTSTPKKCRLSHVLLVLLPIATT
jgi:hypothetical protein